MICRLHVTYIFNCSTFPNLPKFLPWYFLVTKQKSCTITVFTCECTKHSCIKKPSGITFSRNSQLNSYKIWAHGETIVSCSNDTLILSTSTKLILLRLSRYQTFQLWHTGGITICNAHCECCWFCLISMVMVVKNCIKNVSKRHAFIPDNFNH